MLAGLKVGPPWKGVGNAIVKTPGVVWILEIVEVLSSCACDMDFGIFLS